MRACIIPTAARYSGLEIAAVMQRNTILVYDRKCNWTAVYNADGSYRHGAVNKASYQRAVRLFIAGLI